MNNNANQSPAPQSRNSKIVTIVLFVVLAALTILAASYLFITDNAVNKSNDRQNQSTEVRSSQSSNTQAQPAANGVQTRDFKINELGITVKMPNDLQNIEVLPVSSSSYPTVELSTKQFRDLINACRKQPESTSISVGSLAKINGTPTAETFQAYEAAQKQLNGFYLSYSNADGGLCNNGDTGAADAALAEFKRLNTIFITAVQSATQ